MLPLNVKSLTGVNGGDVNALRRYSLRESACASPFFPKYMFPKTYENRCFILITNIDSNIQCKMSHYSIIGNEAGEGVTHGF